MTKRSRCQRNSGAISREGDHPAAGPRLGLIQAQTMDAGTSRDAARSDAGNGADSVCHGSLSHAGVGDEALEAVWNTWADMEFDGHAGLG